MTIKGRELMTISFLNSSIFDSSSFQSLFQTSQAVEHLIDGWSLARGTVADTIAAITPLLSTVHNPTIQFPIIILGKSLKLNLNFEIFLLELEFN